MRVFVSSTVLCVIILTAIVAYADDLAGVWKGTWTKGWRRLACRDDFREDRRRLFRNL